MSSGSTLSKLSAALDPAERKRMLESIRANSESDDAPLVVEPEPQVDAIEDQYRKLGFFDRIRLYLCRLFHGCSRVEMLTRWATQALAVRVQQRAGNGLDTRQRLFLDPFAEAIARLSATLTKAKEYLQVSATRRVDLVLHLVESVAPSVHRRLMDVTSAAQITGIDNASDRELKNRLLASMEKCMLDLGATTRRLVHEALAQADALHRLAESGLSSILVSFNGDATERSRTCSFDHVKQPIEQLAVEFSGLHRSISPLLAQSLVVVEGGSSEPPPETDSADPVAAPATDSPRSPDILSDVAARGIARIDAVIDALRNVGRRYPFVSIARLIHNDPWWNPQPVAPPNDWHTLYRSVFTQRIQRHLLTASLRRQINEQIETLADIAETRPLPMPGLEAFDVQVSLRATALYLFTTRLYEPILPVLRLILTDGEFYKSSNRAQFNDTYGELERLPQMVQHIAQRVAPGSEWQQMLVNMNQENDATDEARQEILDAIRDEFQRIAAHTSTTLDTMVKLLDGILYAKPGSTYDTLANLRQLGGRRNAKLIEDVRLVHMRMRRFLAALSELVRIERRAAEKGIKLNPLVREELS